MALFYVCCRIIVFNKIINILIFDFCIQYSDNNYNYFLLTFDIDARNNKGYVSQQLDDKYKLYFKWDWIIKNEKIKRGKNDYKFENFNLALDFLLEIDFCNQISICKWKGSTVEVIELFKWFRNFKYVSFLYEKPIHPQEVRQRNELYNAWSIKHLRISPKNLTSGFYVKSTTKLNYNVQF